MYEPMAIDPKDKKSSQERSSSRKGRKRKVPDNVSPNACTNCKKARSRCTGVEPFPCSRCVSRDMGDQCHYEVHVKTVKEEMIRKIKILEEKKAELAHSTKQKDLYIESIFETLSTAGCSAELIERLRSAQSQQYLEIPAYDRSEDRSDDIGRSSPDSVRSFSPAFERRLPDVVARIEQVMSINTDQQTTEVSNVAPTGAQWMSKATRQALTEHLLELFFAWVHPVHTLFSERHFSASFRNGDGVYACPSLVSAACALGSLYLVIPDAETKDMRLLTERFLDDVREDIVRVKLDSPMFAATYALMFLAELGLGHGRKAAPYLRLAAESLSNINKQGVDIDAVDIISAGVVNLEIMWSSFTYKLPLFPFPRSHDYSLSCDPDGSECRWQPQRSNIGIPVGGIRTSQSDFNIAKHLTELNRIILDNLTIYTGSTTSLSANLVYSMYRRYRQWYEALPRAMALTDEVEKPAHVLFLHIYYQVAICQLFHPLTVHSRLSSVARHRICGIVFRSAQRGVQLLERHRKSFSGRCQVPLQLLCTIHLCDSVLRNSRASDQNSAVVSYCNDALHEAAANLPLAEPLQQYFAREIATIYFPSSSSNTDESLFSYSHEDMLEAIGRLTHAQPARAIAAHFDGEHLGAELEQLLPEFDLVEAGVTTSAGSGSRAEMTRSRSGGSASPAPRAPGSSSTQQSHRGSITVQNLINPS